MSERQGCWQGLATVLREGLEGYPPPVALEPYVKPVYSYQRKTDRREGLREWGDVT